MVAYVSFALVENVSSITPALGYLNNGAGHNDIMAMSKVSTYYVNKIIIFFADFRMWQAQQ